jgi:transcriptional regulator with XRE-family HTH domain
MTQTELAEQAGIHATYLSKAESGKATLSEATIRVLAECLGTDPDQLVLSAGKIPERLQADIAAKMLAEGIGPPTT